MSTRLDLEVPPAPPTGPVIDAEVHPPRWRRWLIAVLGVVVLAAAAYLVVRHVGAARSRPIVEGSGYRGISGRVGKSLGTFNTPSGDQMDAYEVPFRSGRSFSYWVDLYNDGSRTVTITHIGPPVPAIGQPEHRQWEITSRVANQAGRDLRSWHTITLAAQGNVETLTTVHMTGCMYWNPHGAGWEVFGDTPVTYSVSGAQVHALVPMDFSITMTATKSSACPT